MSSYNIFTNNLYDDCNLEKKNQESVGPYNWVIDNVKHAGCFHNDSPYMQSNANNVPNNLVDIENNIRNQQRKKTRCIHDKHIPSKNYDCSDCDKNVYCNCETKNVLKDSECSGFLKADYTRKSKSVNLSGISINRFSILNENLQDLNKIHGNNIIGLNTRLFVKDNFNKK